MRLFLAICAAGLPLLAQHTMYVTAATTKGYVVGAKLPPSGVFRREGDGKWHHAGFNIPFVSSLAFDARSPETLYLAAGNGLIEMHDHAERWKILTGSDVTELRDAAIDPNAPGSIYFSHTAGVAATHDGGRTWTNLTPMPKRPYSDAIRVDRAHAGVLAAGTESGVYVSRDEGRTWKLAGAAGYQIMHIEQSPHDGCFWIATSQRGGLFASHDCAATFEAFGRMGIDRNLYDVSFDPGNAKRILVAGFGFGVALSEDAGLTWSFRNAGLPKPDVWSVAFDPDRPGRIYASVHEEAVFVSNDSGKIWRDDGLPGSAVYRMQFVPEAK